MTLETEKYKESQLQRRTRYEHESGNVLFLILLAVALFAALSYAVTATDSNPTGDSETVLISSAQLTQYPLSVRTAVTRMIIEGADVEDLEFNEPAEFENCSVGTNFEYCVFHPNGGKATYRDAPPDVMSSGGGNPDGEWRYNAENEVKFVGTTGDVEGTPEEGSVELIAFLSGVSKGVCRRINQQLGIDEIPVESGIDITTNKVNTDGSSPVEICEGGCAGTIGGQDAPALDGKAYACFELNSGSDNFVYYHTLVER